MIAETVVKDLNKIREPIPAMEAIYLISPSDSSLYAALMNDYLCPSSAVYKCAHFYFTEGIIQFGYLVSWLNIYNKAPNFIYAECPGELFNELRNHLVSKFIRTLEETNVTFLPLESNV